MSAYRNIRLFVVLATMAVVAGHFTVSDAFAGKEVFQRVKPHVSVGSIGSPRPRTIKAGS